jgi:hypothetical protein
MARKDSAQGIEDTSLSLRCQRPGCDGSVSAPWKDLDHWPGFRCPKCRAYWFLTDNDRLAARSDHMQNLQRLKADASSV